MAALAALAALAVAGCGGGGKPKEAATQLVSGAGFRFRSPADWPVKRGPHVVSAARPGSDTDLVSVSTFRLPRVPTTAQIDAGAEQLARTLRGRVTSRRFSTIAGGRARSFELSYRRGGKDLGIRLSFVLRGRREYQLLCRWEAPPGNEISTACDLLAASFRPG